MAFPELSLLWLREANPSTLEVTFEDKSGSGRDRFVPLSQGFAVWETSGTILIPIPDFHPLPRAGNLSHVSEKDLKAFCCCVAGGNFVPPLQKKKKIKEEPPFIFQNCPRCLWFGIFFFPFLWKCLVCVKFIGTCSAHSD